VREQQDAIKEEEERKKAKIKIITKGKKFKIHLK
jgi:hypothetical protein